MKLCPNCRFAYSGDHWRCPACDWRGQMIDGFPALAPELAHSGAGFQSDWFSELEELEQSSFWFAARSRLILWAIRQAFPNASNLLEVGCGTGWVLASIAQACPQLRLTGTEVFSAGLEIAARRVPGAAFLQMDARHIPFEAEFDVVGAFDVIEHIAEDERVLGELHRALRPGGGLLLTVPQHRWLWSQADVYARHERRYSSAELHAKVAAAGFKILLSTSFVSLLLPLMLFSRLRKRTAHGSVGAPTTTELALPRPVNAVLGAMMALERWAVIGGVRFPVGGSRLLVAQAL